MLKTQDNEIDIFKLLKTLWDSKWIISSFVILALFLGAGFYLNTKPIYLSKLSFSIDIAPIFLEEIDGTPKPNKVLVDLENLFYSANVFEEWRNINKNTLINYENFNKTKIINGIVFKNPDTALTIISDDKNKNNFFILIKSNNLKFIDDVYNYFTYVNNLLKSNYILEATNALSIWEKKYDLLSRFENKKINYMNLKIFLMKMENERGPLIINRPTFPEKVSTKLSFFLSL